MHVALLHVSLNATNGFLKDSWSLNRPEWNEEVSGKMWWFHNVKKKNCCRNTIPIRFAGSYHRDKNRADVSNTKDDGRGALVRDTYFQNDERPMP